MATGIHPTSPSEQTKLVFGHMIKFCLKDSKVSSKKQKKARYVCMEKISLVDPLVEEWSYDQKNALRMTNRQKKKTLKALREQHPIFEFWAVRLVRRS